MCNFDLEFYPLPVNILKSPFNKNGMYMVAKYLQNLIKIQQKEILIWRIQKLLLSTCVHIIFERPKNQLPAHISKNGQQQNLEHRYIPFLLKGLVKIFRARGCKTCCKIALIFGHFFNFDLEFDPLPVNILTNPLSKNGLHMFGVLCPKMVKIRQGQSRFWDV